VTYQRTVFPEVSSKVLQVAQLNRTILGYPKMGSMLAFNQETVLGSTMVCSVKVVLALKRRISSSLSFAVTTITTWISRAEFARDGIFDSALSKDPVPENIIARDLGTNTGCRHNRVFGICFLGNNNLGDGGEQSL